jgi:hypothetical protein
MLKGHLPGDVGGNASRHDPSRTHIPGGGRPLLRESGPASSASRPSRSSSPNPSPPHHPSSEPRAAFPPTRSDSQDTLSRPLTLSDSEAKGAGHQDWATRTQARRGGQLIESNGRADALSHPLTLSDSMLRGTGALDPSDVEYGRLLPSGTHTTVTARSCTFAAHIRRSRLDSAHIRHIYDCQTRCCVASAPLTRPASDVEYGRLLPSPHKKTPPPRTLQ